jgi:ribosomal protein S19E (S16A)
MAKVVIRLLAVEIILQVVVAVVAIPRSLLQRVLEELGVVAQDQQLGQELQAQQILDQAVAEVLETQVQAAQAAPA